MGEKVIVLDRGNVEFLYPGDWLLAGPATSGYLTLTDPTESCRLEVSYMTVPAEAADIPVVELLNRLLDQIPEAGSNPEIEERSESESTLAWAEASYPSTDKRSGEPKEARGRWLVGTNDIFQVLMTFYYWADDADWALPVWKRIVDTLQLGTGAQLENPEDHWSMRRSN
jgi:hypothetical protein